MTMFTHVMPALLIPGRHFTDFADLREQIRRIFQSGLNYAGVLGELNALGQSQGNGFFWPPTDLVRETAGVYGPIFLGECWQN